MSNINPPPSTSVALPRSSNPTQSPSQHRLCDKMPSPTLSQSRPKPKDHYATLNLPFDCTRASILASFLSLSRRLQERSQDNDKLEDFEEIRNAYDVLSDPEQKRKYDEELGKDFGRV